MGNIFCCYKIFKKKNKNMSNVKKISLNETNKSMELQNITERSPKISPSESLLFETEKINENLVGTSKKIIPQLKKKDIKTKVKITHILESSSEYSDESFNFEEETKKNSSNMILKPVRKTHILEESSEEDMYYSDTSIILFESDDIKNK